jgi:hypothetical protein
VHQPFCDTGEQQFELMAGCTQVTCDLGFTHVLIQLASAMQRDLQCLCTAAAAALQYGLSGILEQPTLGQTLPGTPIPTLDTLLFTYAMLHWLIFDKTPQGFGMAALTAVCGPAVEMLLINVLGLYHYSHPEVLGVPTWIPWVYFCGGPAVGNLGRRVWSQLKLKS